jgi:plasmid stabilization system protein ParE
VAILIKWSDEAVKTFDDNIVYLMKEWSENEIRKFIKQTNTKIKSIELNPKLYRRSEKNPQIRRAGINKNITLFYQYLPTKMDVFLLTFWNNRQDPKKLKY